MEIKAQKFTLEMNENELWATAFDVKWKLESTLKTHWVNYQDSWQKNEQERMDRLRTMFYALWRPDVYNEITETAKKIFDDFNTIKCSQSDNPSK